MLKRTLLYFARNQVSVLIRSEIDFVLRHVRGNVSLLNPPWVSQKEIELTRKLK